MITFQGWGWGSVCGWSLELWVAGHLHWSTDLAGVGKWEGCRGNPH